MAEALKWVGYLIVAIVLITLFAGISGFVIAAAVIMGGVALVVTIILVVAALIKGAWEGRSR